MKQIAILGSTGSIGQSTLSIIEKYPERFSVASLAAGQNIETAFEQCKRWRPAVVSMATDETAATLELRLKQAGITGIEVVVWRCRYCTGGHDAPGRLRGLRHRRRLRTGSNLRCRPGRKTGRPRQQRGHGGSRRDSRRSGTCEGSCRCCRSTPSTMQSINACGRGKSAMYGGSG